MADIIDFSGTTKVPISADAMLEKAKGQFERVVIIGIIEGDNDEPHILASDPSLVYVLFDLERAKDWVIREVRPNRR